jgi:lipopolysaccharide export system permease protein
MRLINKYLYIELLKPFILFSFTFIGILWLVQILPKLETLVLNKQPMSIFLNVSMHTVPQVAYFVIPVAAFFSTIYTINKMVSEAEVIVISSSGVSFFSYAKIIFTFGITVSAILFLITFLILPKSAFKLQSIFFDIEQNYAVKFIDSGKFLHPMSGVTIYVRDKLEENQMMGVFVFDDRSDDYSLLYSAKEAAIRENDSIRDLIMQDGELQIASKNEKSVVSIRFERFGINLNSFLPDRQYYSPSPSDVSPFMGIMKSRQLAKFTEYTSSEYLAESHMKLASILSPIALCMLAAISLILFSSEKARFTTIVISLSLIALIMQGAIFTLKSLIVQHPDTFILIYMPPIMILLAVLIAINFKDKFN